MPCQQTKLAYATDSETTWIRNSQLQFVHSRTDGTTDWLTVTRYWDITTFIIWNISALQDTRKTDRSIDWGLMALSVYHHYITLSKLAVWLKGW